MVTAIANCKKGKPRKKRPARPSSNPLTHVVEMFGAAWDEAVGR